MGPHTQCSFSSYRMIIEITLMVMVIIRFWTQQHILGFMIGFCDYVLVMKDVSN